jgi:GTP 3',8-cyclase
MDPFGRALDYLRISVTDRCNERCLYCMPKGGSDRSPLGRARLLPSHRTTPEDTPGDGSAGASPYRGQSVQPHSKGARASAGRPALLSANEIARVTRVAAGLGFRKFRLTGGEPLTRPDLLEIVRLMAAVRGVACLGLSTNGARLASLARPLREAGLRTVNVSLDALDGAVYRRITGGDVELVLAGIRAAVAAGFERIKLNCVLMRGMNESELWPLVLFAAEHGLPLRLIELMPVTTREVLTERNFMPATEAMRRLGQRDELIPQPDRRLGWGPARYYRLRQTGALVGFIGAITTPHFCESCNRMRLTADGKLRPCLGDGLEVDLHGALRENRGEEAVREALLAALRQKPWQHQFHGRYHPCRPMPAIGG